MKKSIIVLALAVALVLLFAATAMARPSGNIYISWDAGSPGNAGSLGTPHADYQLATEKCAVCHSVHYAAPASKSWNGGAGGTTWTSGENTQMLLRSSVAEACNYCHIETSIGGVQIYGGIVANYTTNSGFNHYGGPAACSGCHAVHGANTFAGGNADKILRVRSDRPSQPELFADETTTGDIDSIWATRGDDVIEADKYTQQISFCTQCHVEYTTASEATIPSSPGYYSGGYDGDSYKGHPMKSADTTFAAAGATFFDQVAWVDSDTCRSCHDAGNVNESGVTSNSFPHYTNGFYVFSDYGEYMGDAQGPDNTREFANDGNCLKCHVNGSQTSGVNLTY